MAWQAWELVKATVARRRGQIADEDIPSIVDFVLAPHGRPVVTYLGYARPGLTGDVRKP